MKIVNKISIGIILSGLACSQGAAVSMSQWLTKSATVIAKAPVKSGILAPVVKTSSPSWFKNLALKAKKSASVLQSNQKYVVIGSSIAAAAAIVSGATWLWNKKHATNMMPRPQKLPFTNEDWMQAELEMSYEPQPQQIPFTASDYLRAELENSSKKHKHPSLKKDTKKTGRSWLRRTGQRVTRSRKR